MVWFLEIEDVEFDFGVGVRRFVRGIYMWKKYDGRLRWWYWDRV